MSKRMYDTGIIQQSWYMELPPRSKALWWQLHAMMDNAGVFEINERMMEVMFGDKVTKSEIFGTFGGRVQPVPNHPDKGIFVEQREGAVQGIAFAEVYHHAPDRTWAYGGDAQLHVAQAVRRQGRAAARKGGAAQAAEAQACQGAQVRSAYVGRGEGVHRRNGLQGRPRAVVELLRVERLGGGTQPHEGLACGRPHMDIERLRNGRYPEWRCAG